MNFDFKDFGYQNRLLEKDKNILDILNTLEVEKDFLNFLSRYGIKHFFMREGAVEIDLNTFELPSSKEQVVYLDSFDEHYTEITSRVKVWLMVLYQSKISVKFSQNEVTYGSFE